MKPRTFTSHYRSRRGYSLIELTISLAAAVVLMAGMASAVVVSTRSLTVGDTGGGARAASTDVQRDFLADLQRATGFTERTANAVTFTVPDRTGDGRPETLRYAWSGTAGDPLTLQMNGGTVQNLATDVRQFSLSFRTNSLTAPVVPDESPPSSGRLLFVSGGTYTPPTFIQALNGQPGTITLTAGESAKVALFQSWGFAVTNISALQSSNDFTNAYSKNDVIFVSSEPGTTIAGSTLKTATLGLVNENPAIAATLGFYSGSSVTSGTNTRIGATPHYITTGYTAQQTVALTTTTTEMQSFPASRSLYLTILGTNPMVKSPNFATLAAGRKAVDGTPVPQRRVQLPWSVPSFNSTLLAADGQTLLKTSLLWAVGNGADGDPSMVTVGPTDEAALWGYFYDMQAAIVASHVSLPVKGELRELTAYIRSNSLPVRMAIYSDKSGAPDKLLAQTGLVAGSSSTGWLTGSIPATTLDVGTYWLAVSLSNTDQRVYYDNASGVTTAEITNRPFSTGNPSSWSSGSSSDRNTYTKTQLLMYGSYIALP